MILHVTKANYLEDYRIEVAFNNGKIGIVDLSQCLTGLIFAALKDLKMFSQLKLDTELNTIVWPNGADLAPEYLYFQAFKEAPELQNEFKQWGFL